MSDDVIFQDEILKEMENHAAILANNEIPDSINMFPDPLKVPLYVSTVSERTTTLQPLKVEETDPLATLVSDINVDNNETLLDNDRTRTLSKDPQTSIQRPNFINIISKSFLDILNDLINGVPQGISVFQFIYDLFTKDNRIVLTATLLIFVSIFLIFFNDT